MEIEYYSQKGFLPFEKDLLKNGLRLSKGLKETLLKALQSDLSVYDNELLLRGAMEALAERSGLRSHYLKDKEKEVLEFLTNY